MDCLIYKKWFKKELSLNDKELVDAVLKGNKAAFKTIVERYQKQVASTVFGMLGYCAEAEDVGQEVFIRFYNVLDKFRYESSIGTYLTRIAVNLCLNHIQKERKKKDTFCERLPENIPETLNVEDKMTVDCIHQAILKLKPRYRAVVLLRLVHGYSTQETADILSAPPNTVMSWLSRALKNLRSNIEEGDHI